jgi:hypothetical protein
MTRSLRSSTTQPVFGSLAEDFGLGRSAGVIVAAIFLSLIGVARALARVRAADNRRYGFRRPHPVGTAIAGGPTVPTARSRSAS